MRWSPPELSGGSEFDLPDARFQQPPRSGRKAMDELTRSAERVEHHIYHPKSISEEAGGVTVPSYGALGLESTSKHSQTRRRARARHVLSEQRPSHPDQPY